MMPPTEGDAAFDEAAKTFVRGQIRDELNLKSADLTIGLEVAKNLLKRGAATEALRIYAGLILCEPANIEFQVGLANCALLVDEPHLALQAASAVIALAPRDPRGYLLSGRACIGLGALAEAAEDLNDALTFGREARDARVVEEAQRHLQALPSGAERATTPAAG